MADEKRKTADGVEEEPLNEEQESKKHKPAHSRWRNMMRNITVEPMLAGLIIPSVISRFAMGNLNLDKACRVNLQFDDMICDALVKKTSNNFTEYERKVQELISSIDIWKSVISTGLPCLLVMFLGSWSDRTGKRKIIILLPIYGELLTSINNLVNVYFFYEIPVQVTVFLETLFSSITGGYVTMFLGVFSYISDITTEESRTFRVGVVNFCMTVGLPIGMALSGVLVTYMGYYALFSTTAILFTLVLIYGNFCLSEPDDILKKRGQTPVSVMIFFIALIYKINSENYITSQLQYNL